MDNIIGAIDGTFVAMKAPKEQVRSYTNRKCFTSVTLQAICDHRMKFLDCFARYFHIAFTCFVLLSFYRCFARYPSSVGDARILRNSDIFEDITNSVGDFFSEDEVILGDKAYPVTGWCIPPFINRTRLTAPQILFNKKQASARSIIERSFALLFGRFRRLRYLDMNRIEFIPATILASCVLHNICLEYGDEANETYIQEGIEHVVGNTEDVLIHIEQRSETDRVGNDLRNKMVHKIWNLRRNADI